LEKNPRQFDSDDRTGFCRHPSRRAPPTLPPVDGGGGHVFKQDERLVVAGNAKDCARTLDIK